MADNEAFWKEEKMCETFQVFMRNAAKFVHHDVTCCNYSISALYMSSIDWFRFARFIYDKMKTRLSVNVGVSLIFFLLLGLKSIWFFFLILDIIDELRSGRSVKRMECLKWIQLWQNSCNLKFFSCLANSLRFHLGSIPSCSDFDQ